MPPSMTLQTVLCPHLEGWRRVRIVLALDFRILPKLLLHIR